MYAYENVNYLANPCYSLSKTGLEASQRRVWCYVAVLSSVVQLDLPENGRKVPCHARAISSKDNIPSHTVLIWSSATDTVIEFPVRLFTFATNYAQSNHSPVLPHTREWLSQLVV